MNHKRYKYRSIPRMTLMADVPHEHIGHEEMQDMLLGLVQSSVSDPERRGELLRRNTELADLIRKQLREPQQIVSQDISGGRRVYVAVGNNIMSPFGLSLGGCRWVRYKDAGQAEQDVRKLAAGMTYKWAILSEMMAVSARHQGATPEEVSATRMGGGKCVIYEPADSGLRFTPQGQPLSDAEHRVLEEAVEVMRPVSGYITAPDAGTDMRHMQVIKGLMPDRVVCLPVEEGGSGDPSIVTAKGVYESMLAWVRFYKGQDEFRGLTIAVQGVGKVGGYLLKDLVRAHSYGGSEGDYAPKKLVIAEPNDDLRRAAEDMLKQRRIDYQIVEPDSIYDQQFDVLSPNARGQVLTPDHVARMVEANNGKELLIVGAANNQMDDTIDGAVDETERLFREYHIHYAPDFVVNLGGILNVIYEFPLVKKMLQRRVQAREPWVEPIWRRSDAKPAEITYQQERPLEIIAGVRSVLHRIHERAQARYRNEEHPPSTRLIAERMAAEQMARWALYKGLTSEDITARRYESRREQ